MPQHHVLLLSQDNIFYHDLLTKRALPDLRIISVEKINKQDYPSIDIVLGEPLRIAPLLSQLPNLKWVQSTYAGVESLIAPHLRQDYQLTNAHGIFSQQICEYVFGHLFNLTRHLDIYRLQQKKRIWQRHAYQSLCGRNLLILGTGHIGQAIAALAKAFEMSVLGVNKHGHELAHFDATYTVDALPNLLHRADVLINTLPSTPETRQLLTLEKLRTIKLNAIFINVGRSDVLDSQTTLETLLREKILQAAVIDVFDNEPLPPDSSLWSTPHLIITPHNAAYSFPESVTDLFTRNYLRFTDGKALQGLVDFYTGY